MQIKLAIADDDPVYQFLVTRMLKRNALFREVGAFNDGEEALDFMKKNASKIELLPDVLMVDLKMPNIDGWELLDELIDIFPTLAKKPRVYIASTAIEEEDRERAKKYPWVRGFLQKPFSEDQVKQLVADSAK